MNNPFVFGGLMSAHVLDQTDCYAKTMQKNGIQNELTVGVSPAQMKLLSFG